MTRKKALIFGITGQDGSYLAKYLIEKNYLVTGIYRRKNFVNLKKLDLLKKLELKLVKRENENKIIKILKKNFDEIYFLGGQSSVFDSFNKESETYFSQIKPVKIILNYILNQKTKKSKFLYAGSSEIYGNIHGKKKIKEDDQKKPVSPYGLSKLIAYEIIKSYSSIVMRKDYQKINIPKLPIFSTEEGITRIKSILTSLIDWKDMNKLIPKTFLSTKKLKKTGTAGIFSGSLELVKEGDLIMKQSKLFDKIYIKQKI